MILKTTSLNIGVYSKTAKGQVFCRRLIKRISILSCCFGSRKEV